MWLGVEWLPAYAPDLNPFEALWSHANYSALANFVPDDVDQLYDAVVNAVGDVNFRPLLLRSFMPLSYDCKWFILRTAESTSTSMPDFSLFVALLATPQLSKYKNPQQDVWPLVFNRSQAARKDAKPQRP